MLGKGYTQMMAENESRAKIIRKRHREVFEDLHEKYKGEIIQYFGDGTLSIFDSCVEAVHCAVTMQQAFLQEPQVPLRIGIHLGDIEYSETEVAGNGVNIAARVESLGVAGSILLSDGVRKQVENHQIETVSMGHFEMKNVVAPMEVFAVTTEGLYVPNPKSLQGKAKRINTKLQTQRIVRFASIGFVVMLLGAVLFWAFGSNGKDDQPSEKTQRFPEFTAIIPHIPYL